MTAVALVLVLIIAGVVLQFVSMDERMKSIIIAVIAIFALACVLSMLGLLPSHFHL